MKKLAVGIAATVLVIGLGAMTALAAGRTQEADGAAPAAGSAAQTAAVESAGYAYVDENGNGICDHCEDGTGLCGYCEENGSCPGCVSGCAGTGAGTDDGTAAGTYTGHHNYACSGYRSGCGYSGHGAGGSCGSHHGYCHGR